ncbi:UTRA domain-containing protein [Salinihabitans flavidus]|uniref:UTRA domain-containing protein n=2 Tax=Salinihabitans flavidus TaxID=569882 RepID=A0A1H8S477_9RHOB|nr:UTRA domain-containing protein [Salinihabitans flavidus]
MIRIPSIREEIEAQGHIYRYELLQRRLAKPSKAVAEGLGVDEDTRLLNLRCRHWAGRQVFQYENRWINPDSAPGASEQSFEDFGPNDWLINTVPYSNVDHEISAVSATRITAPVMDVPVATPLLQVRRLTSLHGIGVTAVTLLHPGHDYVLRSAHSTETSQT